MPTHRILCSVLVSTCVSACALDDPEVAGVGSVEQAASLSVRREHVTADIYHYELVVPVGDGPNAALRLHRVVREVAPFVPRRTARAVMLVHGYLSTFVTNFAPTLGDPASPVPGLAPYLAAHDVDVWGVDRRSSLAAAGGDLSDFGSMGAAQDLDDLGAALALARATRLAGGSGGGTVALVGYSYGGELAYLYAAVEAARPPGQRHVRALAAIDYPGALGPEQQDLQAELCALSAGERQAVAEGVVDAPNQFFIALGQLARTAPDLPSPLLPGLSNRAAMLVLVGQVGAFAPFFQLLAPIVDGGRIVGLRETSENAATAWLAGAPPHSAMRESADLDALLCGQRPLPLDAPLARIQVPLLYLGAAGGVGDVGLYATTQVGSSDVTTLVVRRFGPERQAEDFGHVDLLFADAAPTLAWHPLLAWLTAH